MAISQNEIPMQAYTVLSAFNMCDGRESPSILPEYRNTTILLPLGGAVGRYGQLATSAVQKTKSQSRDEQI